MRAPFHRICGSRSGSRSRVCLSASGVRRGKRTGATGSVSSMRSAIDCSSAVGMFLRVASSWVSAATFLVPLPAIVRAIFLRQLPFTHKARDQPVEGVLHRKHVGELGELPAAKAAEIVHARHPQRSHRLGLELRIAAAVALGLENKVEGSSPPFSTCTMKSGTYFRGTAPSR